MSCKNCKRFLECREKVVLSNCWIEGEELIFFFKDLFYEAKFSKKIKLNKTVLPSIYQFIERNPNDLYVLDLVENNHKIEQILGEEFLYLDSKTFEIIEQELKKYEKEFCPFYFENIITGKK